MPKADVHKGRARWQVASDPSKVALTSDVGKIEAAALDIWDAEFGTLDIVSGYSVGRPSEDLPNIDFSRFPLELSLVASGSLVAGLSLTLVGKLGSSTIELAQAVPSQLLLGESWALVQVDVVDELNRMLSAKGISLSGKINAGQLIWLRTNEDLPLPFEDRTEFLNSSGGQLPWIANIGLRAGTHLYPYQQSGVAFLASVARDSIGCVLADEMGLGKTLQVIALLSIEAQAERRPNLIVCPATLLENWRREIAAFAPQLSILTHSGPSRAGVSSALLVFDVVITSYDTAVRDEPMLSSIAWNVVALDEAQNIKNPDAQRTNVVKALPRRVSLAVTGTPVENRLTDLWSIADFALPGLLGSQRRFEASYDDTHQDATKLAPIVAPIILRRRVAEVATDLPPRLDVPQAVGMTLEMATQYEAIRQDVAADYGKSATLVSLGKLRQFCAHPILLDFVWADPAAGMPKYTRLVEILDEIFSRGQKALIFCSFTAMTDILIKDLPARFQGCFAGFIDGRVNINQRQDLVDQFTSHNGFGFLALNPKAAGVGLNITAANHVIHYNPEWNPALEDQASARAHRRKQTLPVTVHQLYFADTVEEVVVDRLNLKRRISNGAVVGHSGSMDSGDIARALQVSPFGKKGMLE